MIRNIYVARQPIFDRHKNIFAYELLFRSGFDNFYDSLDGDYASTRTMLNSFFLLGMDTITGGKMAFVNFTRNLLLNEVATIFPKELLAVEVLENVTADDAVVASCKKLSKSGYLIILDDFMLKPDYEPLIEVADIIKVDFKLANHGERKKILDSIGRNKHKFLAEKVETLDEFNQAKDQGFAYFQGYFFSKPHIVAGASIPPRKLTYMQIIQEMNSPDMEFDLLEHIVKRDMAITYKLLKLINSAAFGLRTRVQSIRHALTLLGINEIRKWITFLAMSEMGSDKPDELLILAMTRAKFGEIMASKIGMLEREADFFLLGMFSMLDAFIDRPIADILEELPISDEIRDALTGKDNRFRDAFELIVAYERADWTRFSIYAKRLGLNERLAPDIYYNALQWALYIFKV
ncbi:MAG: HDOD domain-containing protein [Spirochaetes bacterium]|nr:MAG: HDOD domain-containing protein [Spirochaetota bacterium]